MTPTSDRPAAVVTGVSSGIGLSIAEELLKRGYRVFGSVRREMDAELLVTRWPGAFVPLVFDVTDDSALSGVVQQVRAALGGKSLKALVNNAGISHSGPLMLQPLEEIRQTFEVNVFGLLAVTRAFLPLLGGNRGAGHPPGRIVNIGSLSGAITVPFMASYSGSKHAVEAFSQGLRRELLPFGIEVATIEPGFIRSRMFEKAAPTEASDRYANTAYSEAWRQFNRSLLKQERTAKPPEVVTRAVVHAIEASRPRTRYRLDPLWYIGRLLPDRGFDRLIFKALGLTTLMRSARPLSPNDPTMEMKQETRT